MESTPTGSYETETSRDQRRRELREKIARRRAIDRAKRMDLYAIDDRRVEVVHQLVASWRARWIHPVLRTGPRFLELRDSQRLHLIRKILHH